MKTNERKKIKVKKKRRRRRRKKKEKRKNPSLSWSPLASLISSLVMPLLLKFCKTLCTKINK